MFYTLSKILTPNKEKEQKMRRARLCLCLHVSLCHLSLLVWGSIGGENDAIVYGSRTKMALGSEPAYMSRSRSENLANKRKTIGHNFALSIGDGDFESHRFTKPEGSFAPTNEQGSMDTCQLVPIVHALKHPGCALKAISSYACAGACPSYVQTSSSKFWQHERSCSCCQQTGSQEATFTLDCPSLDPPYRKIKTHAPVGCLCRSCTNLDREELRPHELVEAQAESINKDHER